MRKGTIHSKDKDRTYIEVHHKTLKKDKHKHLFPGKKKSKIVPANKKKHHDDFKVGDKVYFNIQKREENSLKTLYLGLPLIGIFIGLIIGSLITSNELGIFILIVLFALLAIKLKHIIGINWNLMREIDVHITEPVSKVEIFKAKKRRKKRK